MALPASGTISFQNFNTDRGLSSTATVDMDTAAIAYGIPTKPHGMDEFYGKSVGGPPPPPPPPPPPVTYYYHYVRPCGGGTPIYSVRHTSYLDVNKAVTLYGPSGCWEVTGTGITPHDYTVGTVYADCTACASTPPPPPPPALSITNGSVTCSSGGNFTSTLSGGTGTYDWVAIDTSPANVSNAIQGISGTRTTPSGGSSHSWISLSNNTYYTAVMDSSGTYQLQTTGVVVNCTAPPPPPPPPVIYTYVSLCGSGGSISGYITGNYTYGTNLEDTTTNDCYIAVGTTTSPTGTMMPHSFTAGTCSCPGPPPPPPSPPPPPPSLTMNISQGCTGYVGTGYIVINSVSGGSGNYVYHIGPLIDFNDPNAYYLNSSQYGLSNGGYYVAVYDSTNFVNVVENRNISCASAPPPPPPLHHLHRLHHLQRRV